MLKVEGTDSVEKQVLQPSRTVSSQSEPTGTFSGALFNECSFSFGSEKSPEANQKK